MKCSLIENKLKQIKTDIFIMTSRIRRPVSFQLMPKAPEIPRPVNLMKKPDAIYYIGSTGTVAHSVFTRLKGLHSRDLSFVFAEDASQASKICKESGHTPIILVNGLHGSSFSTYSLTRFNVAHFIRRSMEWANWLVFISESCAERRAEQCIASLSKWFITPGHWAKYCSLPRVIEAKAARSGSSIRSTQIQLPWGLSRAGDVFVGESD